MVAPSFYEEAITSESAKDSGRYRQTAAITGLESNENSGSHAPDSNAMSPAGIPSRIQMLDLIH